MLYWAGIVIGLVVLGCIITAQFIKRHVENKWPAFGEFATIDGMQIHFVDIDKSEDNEHPPVLFVHGSNGNLRDQMTSIIPMLETRGRLIFIDRPGHGYSTRLDSSYSNPSLQADVLAKLLQHLGVEKAIICGHSLGCAITVAMAVHHPQQISGLLFLAPATHSWPSGVDWHYKMAKVPVVGWIFAFVFAPVIGWFVFDDGIKSVFKPNAVPADYVEKSGTRIALRGRQFNNNALDVAHLNANVIKLSPRYPEIKTPTVIITGDSDDVVLEEIHSEGLLRDIAGSQKVVLAGVGHKPDYLGLNEIVVAIENIAARPRT